MGALSVKQESSSRLVLGKAPAQVASTIFTLLVFVFLAITFIPDLLQRSAQEDPIWLVLAGLFGVFFLSTVYSTLTSTSVTLDASARQATSTTSLLGIRLRSRSVPFERVRRVVVGSRLPVSLNASPARTVWQVALDTTEGAPFVVNYGGPHNEMRTLGDKVSTFMNRPLIDELEQARAATLEGTAQGPIEDFSGGGPPSYAPPVAAPGRIGRRQVSAQVPEKTPPAPPPPAPQETLLEGETQYGQQQAPPAMPTSSSLPLDAGISPVVQPPLNTGISPAVQPPLDTGTSYSSPPPTGAMSASNQPSMSQPPLDVGMPPVFSSPPAMSGQSQPPLGGLTESPTAPMETSVPPEEQKPPTRAAPRPRTLEELQAAIQEDPTNAQLYYQLGRAWQARRAWDQAQQAYQNALRLDPMNAQIQNDLGVLYFLRGSLREAEANFRRALGLDPFFALGHYNLALVFARQGRRAEAAAEFDHAMQEASSDSERNLYAQARTRMGGEPALSPQ